VAWVWDLTRDYLCGVGVGQVDCAGDVDWAQRGKAGLQFVMIPAAKLIIRAGLGASRSSLGQTCISGYVPRKALSSGAAERFGATSTR
jgi:hypothetical protein